jgi:hypothetical protein
MEDKAFQSDKSRTVPMINYSVHAVKIYLHIE